MDSYFSLNKATRGLHHGMRGWDVCRNPPPVRNGIINNDNGIFDGETILIFFNTKLLISSFLIFHSRYVQKRLVFDQA